MKIIIIYHANIESVVKRFTLKLLKDDWTFDEAIFMDQEELKDKLRKRTDLFGKNVYIVFAESKNRLLELTKLESPLRDSQCILMVPEKSVDIMRLAIKVYPNFIMCIDDSYADLSSVLKKMVTKG